jgi:hypothetical protein
MGATERARIIERAKSGEDVSARRVKIEEYVERFSKGKICVR